MKLQTFLHESIVVRYDQKLVLVLSSNTFEILSRLCDWQRINMWNCIAVVFLQPKQYKASERVMQQRCGWKPVSHKKFNLNFLTFPLFSKHLMFHYIARRKRSTASAHSFCIIRLEPLLLFAQNPRKMYAHVLSTYLLKCVVIQYSSIFFFQKSPSTRRSHTFMCVKILLGW